MVSVVGLSGGAFAHAEVAGASQLLTKGPVYPAAMLVKNETGHVTLTADIDKTGHTVNCQIIATTNPGFNESALDYCRRELYRPAARNGHPVVEHRHRINVDFSLDK
ncbi:energy transducer TonB [Gluconobacter kanchanaburiensis]|uniref:energy transducer TonB n=1 Tax=Gluconobacter kanchanaburiensis TaxID=563199 RepID=UPI0036D3D3F7